jgi:hypothetical protein
VDACGVPEVTATKRILTDFGETFEDYSTKAKHPLKKNPGDTGFDRWARDVIITSKDLNTIGFFVVMKLWHNCPTGEINGIDTSERRDDHRPTL